MKNYTSPCFLGFTHCEDAPAASPPSLVGAETRLQGPLDFRGKKNDSQQTADALSHLDWDLLSRKHWRLSLSSSQNSINDEKSLLSSNTKPARQRTAYAA